MGQAVNSVALVHERTLRVMDFETWRDIADALSAQGRGAQTRFAEHMGMDGSYLSRRLKSDVDLTVSEQRLARSYFSDEVVEAKSIKRASPSSTRKLPVYGFAAAGGEERFVLNDGEILDELELPMGLMLGAGEYFVVIPSGSSMEPRIFPGEPQVVRRNFPPGRDKKAVIEFTDGTAVIKNYRGQKDGRVFVEQFNPPKMLDYDATTVKAIHAVAFSL